MFSIKPKMLGIRSL